MWSIVKFILGILSLCVWCVFWTFVLQLVHFSVIFFFCYAESENKFFYYFLLIVSFLVSIIFVDFSMWWVKHEILVNASDHIRMMRDMTHGIEEYMRHGVEDMVLVRSHIDELSKVAAEFEKFSPAEFEAELERIRWEHEIFKSHIIRRVNDDLVPLLNSMQPLEDVLFKFERYGSDFLTNRPFIIRFFDKCRTFWREGDFFFKCFFYTVNVGMTYYYYYKRGIKEAFFRLIYH